MSFPRHGLMPRGFSTPWTKVFHTVEKNGHFFHTMEKFFCIFPHNGKNVSTPWKNRRPRQPQRGSALIVALWVVLVLSLLIGGMAYEMHIEAGITSYARKRLKAQVAARGGVEYAKFLLSKSFEASAFEESDE